MNNYLLHSYIKKVGYGDAIGTHIDICITFPYGEELIIELIKCPSLKIILLSCSSPKTEKQGYTFYIKLMAEEMHTIFHSSNVLTKSFLSALKQGFSSLKFKVNAAVKGITAHREAMKNTSKLINLPCCLLHFTLWKGTLCYS